MSVIDNKVKAWMESLGYEHIGYDCYGFGGYFCIIKDGKRDVTFMNHIDYSAAKQLYLNPPLDSPAVKRAVLETRIEDPKHYFADSEWLREQQLKELEGEDEN
jgi:hypothetical protein